MMQLAAQVRSWQSFGASLGFSVYDKHVVRLSHAEVSLARAHRDPQPRVASGKPYILQLDQTEYI